MTVNTDQDHAFFANLPLKDGYSSYSYTTSKIDSIRLEFDVYPAFGTTAIGRACLPSPQFKAMIDQSPDGVLSRQCTVALFDSHQRIMGEISFKVLLIQPFLHPSLEIGGTIETYWKSTTVVSTPSVGQDVVHSLLTGTSLVKEYIELVVQPTRDGMIAVYPHLTIPVDGIDVPLYVLSFEEAKRAFKGVDVEISEGSSNEIAEKVYSGFHLLEYALKVSREFKQCRNFHLLLEFRLFFSILNVVRRV
jgi:CDK inhibitor PHO81